MNNSGRLVSVIIPTYNRSETIIRAIQSVLQSTYSDLEIILVDDGSTDNTKNKLMQLRDERIRYYYLPENRGGAAARNAGIEHVRGEYVAFLDSDDEWLKDKLREQIRLFENLDDSYGVIYSGFYVINNNGKIINKFIPEKSGDLRTELISHNCIGTLSSVVIKTEYLQLLGGFDPDLKSCQDWDIYIRAGRMCRFHYVPRCLVKYRGGYGFSRTSISPAAVRSGQKRIAKKYKSDIKGLKRSRRAQRLNYSGRMLIAGGAFLTGWKNILKGSVISLNVVFLIKGVVFSLKTYKRIRASE